MEGQVAHIDQDHANPARENLVYLCHRHHDWYDSKPSQGKGRTPGELRHAIGELAKHLVSLRSQLKGGVEVGNLKAVGQGSHAPALATVLDQRGQSVEHLNNIAGSAVLYPSPDEAPVQAARKQKAAKRLQPATGETPKQTGPSKGSNAGSAARSQAGDSPLIENPLSEADKAAGKQRRFVVFLRIVGLKDMKAEINAGCQIALWELAEKHALPANTALVHHQSSVYGRILFVREAVQAIEVAVAFLQGAAKKGVRLAVGVSVGPIEPTHDFGRWALAGPAISTAARLAHLADSDNRIAVEAGVHSEFCQSTRSEAFNFSDAHEGRVKKTTLHYRWLMVSPGQRRAKAPTVPYTGPRSAHVVVFDLVGFSQRNSDGQWEIVAKLRRHAFEVLGSHSLGDAAERGRFWYAPAGDGGVWVFLPDLGVPKVMSAACQLALKCHKEEELGVELRVSVATGLVVVVGDGLPVGTGILKADELCSLPKAGEVAVSAEFWKQSLECKAPPGWRARLLPDHPEVVILAPGRDSAGEEGLGGDGGGTPPPKGPPAGPEVLLRQALRDNLRVLLSGNSDLCSELVDAVNKSGEVLPSSTEVFVDLVLGAGMAATLGDLRKWLDRRGSKKYLAEIREVVCGLAPLAIRDEAYMGDQRRVVEETKVGQAKPIPLHKDSTTRVAELVVAALLNRRARFTASGDGADMVPFASSSLPSKSLQPASIIDDFLRDLLKRCDPKLEVDEKKPLELNVVAGALRGMWHVEQPLYTLFEASDGPLHQALLDRVGSGKLPLLLLKKSDAVRQKTSDPVEISVALRVVLERLDSLASKEAPST